MRRNDRIALLLALAFLLAGAANLLFGAGDVSPSALIQAIFGGERESVAARIFWFVRLPRALAAMLAGAALSVSGLLLQAVLRNPLAAPGVIGVNAGAGLCVLIGAVMLPNAVRWTPLLAFAGACASAFAVYLIARLTGASRNTLVLAGVAVNTLLGACMDAIVTFYPSALVNRSTFSIGGFANVTMRQLAFAAPMVVLGLLLAAIFHREAEIMALGDDVAESLGVHVERCRALFLIAAAMLAGAAVSFAGLLSFVGLIAPHMARIICRHDARLRTTITALLGAVLCLVCDLAARTLFAPYELPVGIVLSFIGAPFFLYLMLHQRKRGRHAAID